MRNPTIEITIEDDEGEERVVKLPAMWEICRTCHGKGKHSLALGAITQEDRDRDWSPDEWEDYMAGGYDQTCRSCDGTGKVLVANWSAIDADPSLKDDAKAYREILKDDAEYRAMCRLERESGA
jgi:hypothetical protein